MQQALEFDISFGPARPRLVGVDAAKSRGRMDPGAQGSVTHEFCPTVWPSRRAGWSGNLGLAPSTPAPRGFAVHTCEQSSRGTRNGGLARSSTVQVGRWCWCSRRADMGGPVCRMCAASRIQRDAVG